MWREYSADYIRKNKASSISIMSAALISALFLSLLCSLAFNIWTYEVEKIIREEGDWQGRLTGEIGEEQVRLIEKFANVEKVELEPAEGNQSLAAVYFKNKRTIYQDLPLIAEKLGLDEEAVAYHDLLLSRYLIHDPKDEQPPLLLTFFLVVLLFMCISLTLIIHHSFAISMNTRIRQFGIFSSIGATPGQICICLLQEALGLSILPILLGSLLGIAGSFGIIQGANMLAKDVAGREDAVFQYRPEVLLLTLLVSVLTVLFSAWIPARKLSKISPLQAVKGNDDWKLKKKRRSPILTLFFGVEGELAGNALKAQKKALRTSTLSLTFSFLGFTLMLCFLTLAEISTGHTYFERYEDAWDVMAEIKDTDERYWEAAEKIRELPKVQSSVAYQKADWYCKVPKDAVSEEVQKAGGLKSLSGEAVKEENEYFLVKAPVVILDDGGFEEYCRQLGITYNQQGSIVLNRIWDSVHSNFRYKTYLPFVKEKQSSFMMQTKDKKDAFSIPVLGYAAEPPMLREEYDNDSLVQIVPISLWKQVVGSTDSNLYIRVLAEEPFGVEELKELETGMKNCLGQSDVVTIENRIQEKQADEDMQDGLRMILGSFCVLLALIGIANVFSNALGFLRQRKREFARYFSIGMTPESMRKIFFIEALVIAGRPILITAPLAGLSVGFMITASYLKPAEFLEKAPIVPILLFVLLIFVSVGVAYFIGGRSIVKCDLTEALRDDSMI